MFKNLLNKVGWGELPSSFGYVIGDKVELPFQSVWQLHKGQKRSDGSAVSVFICPKKELDMAEVAAAKNAQQLSKSLRHPNIINVFDSCETEGGIYVATEPVTSLLSPEASEEDDGQPEVWGLYQALDALSFLHTSGFVHGLFGPAAIFVSAKGDYRLSGFQLCKKSAECGDLLAGWRRCGPKITGWPEPPTYLVEGGSPTSAVDLWGAVVLAAYVFGSARPGRGRGVDCRIDLARAVQDFPAELQRPLAELQKPGPLRGRSPIAELIALQFFQQHSAVYMMAFLNSLHIKSPEEKEVFFEALPDLLDKVPQIMQTRQVLPDLLQAQKFPGQEAAQVLPSILKIGTRLKDDGFKEKVAPLVVQLFVSPDRSIRFRLLMSIGDMIGNLDDTMINDKIFPECVNGFTDSSGPIREATVKALIHFVPRLKAKTVEGRVIKLLLKLLQDPEASIRTNAVICVGRISGFLPKACASQTLCAALSQGLKDNFAPCRSASLHTLLATCALFPAEELANRLLPQVCMRLVDPDPSVADNAFEVMTALQKHVRKLVDERRAEQRLAAEAGGGDGSTQVGSDASGGSGGTWGSWAMTTVGSRLGNVGALGSLMGSMSSSTPLAQSGATPTTSFSSTTPAAAPPAPSAPASAPASKPTASSGPSRTTSGMSLSSGTQANSSSLDLGGGDGGGAWDEDEFWDDFADDAPVATAPAPAPAAAAAPTVRAKPAPAAAKASVMATPSPKVTAAPAKKASVIKDDEDFWKDFDM